MIKWIIFNRYLRSNLMKIAKIIISEQPIPYHKNGSWTQRIEYFLSSNYNVIDYFICSKSEKSLATKTVFFKVNQFNSRLISKFFPKLRFKNFTKEILQLSKKYDKLILCVIDNVKLKNEIDDFIVKERLKDKITFLFYQCGFSYSLTENEHQKFHRNIDNVILLTQSSYQYDRSRYLEYIPEVTILHNPIDKNKYHSVSPVEQLKLQSKYNINGKVVYLWLSHDREKKGLQIVLNSWKEFYLTHPNSVLLVVGATRKNKIEGVQFFGAIPNDEVPIFYKLAHVFVFSPLWKEGFGLSLAQAICSGCFSIAANSGGVSEFFDEDSGILIETPNEVVSWVNAMQFAHQKINSGWNNPNSGKLILDYNNWSEQFAQVFLKWEKLLND